MIRFTIRELMICTVFVAICCGWWYDHHRLCRSIVSTYHRGKQLTAEYGRLKGVSIGGDAAMPELPRGYILDLGFDLVVPFPAGDGPSAPQFDE